ncbi:radical SAM protein [Desulforudis sp. DRI-14]|uniref:radical SAM protein n=1 Tax=Desulforudis sp. DRI-14 TaxID=3459793 RepID=UPI004041E3E4
MIRVSAATAAVIGLKNSRLDARPSTAYLMAGENCLRSCGFCPQGRASGARTDMLSRVTWPPAEPDRVADLVGRAYEQGRFSRACIQAVQGRGYRREVAGLLEAIKRRTPIPVAVCLAPAGVRELKGWFEQGADRAGLPLDTANPGLHARLKGRSWERDLALIEGAAAAFPGRIGTHLIVGLGETEEEMTRLIGRITGLGVTVGLFAFTPVRGTPLEGRMPPPLASYRRIQAARYLLASGSVAPEGISFRQGRIVDFGVPAGRLRRLLAGGDAFRTSGCPDCNRPFYNERPGGPVYNYPRTLTPEEEEQAIALCCSNGG